MASELMRFITPKSSSATSDTKINKQSKKKVKGGKDKKTMNNVDVIGIPCGVKNAYTSLMEHTTNF